MDQDGKGLGKGLRAFALASTITVQFAVSIVVGLYAGKYLDSWLGTEPWLMLVGILSGVAAGTFGVYRTVQQIFSK